MKVDSILSVLTKLPEDTSKVWALFDLCNHYNQEVDEKKVIETAWEALELSRSTDFDKGISLAYGFLGDAYSTIGNKHKALEYHLLALRIQEKERYLSDLARTYHDIGSIYVYEGAFERGQEYYKKAVTLWKQLGDERGPLLTMYNIGHIYEQQGNDSIALEQYKYVSSQSEKTGTRYVLIASLINMSGIYVARKDYINGFVCIMKALTLVDKSNGMEKELLAEIYGTLSDVYRGQNELSKALTMAEKGLMIGKETKRKLFVLQNYKRLAVIHESMGNHAKGYQSIAYCLALNDTLKNEEGTDRIAKLTLSYELEKKDLELKAQAEQYESRLFRRNTFIVALIVLLLLIFLILNRIKLIIQKKLLVKQQKLKHYTQRLVEKSELIASISQELELLKNSPAESAGSADSIDKFNRIIHLKIHTKEDWEHFKKSFEEVYPEFFAKLRYHYPSITASELRLAAITKLNLSVKEASVMLDISVDSIKQSRHRLKKRLGLEEAQSLKDFIGSL
ncbi:tetratricopeptide repeat protein [Ohtaekwangia koreensis]|uniref:tetratricopeptide repeat protein n=1 Tax=Ohtaekwangia koreensis TaxID=688867 RepID=UPI001C87DEA8|nr:tetratricopeptide repeat protein [Ohtaekwangia koreensis]